MPRRHPNVTICIVGQLGLAIILSSLVSRQQPQFLSLFPGFLVKVIDLKPVNANSAKNGGAYRHSCDEFQNQFRHCRESVFNLYSNESITVMFLTMSNFCFAQQQYDFKDDPWHNSQWYGDTSLFKKITGGLQLNAPPETGSAAIFVASTVISNAEWETSFTMNFNPSANNYLDINLAGHFDQSLID